MTPPLFYAAVDELIDTHDSTAPMYVGTLERRLFEHERDSDTGLYVVVSDFDKDGALRSAKVLATARTVIADKDELALAKAIQHRCANLVMKHIQDRHACHVIRAFVGVDRNLLWPDATISFAEFSGGEWVPVTRFE